jgi:hypothetical protein
MEFRMQKEKAKDRKVVKIDLEAARAKVTEKAQGAAGAARAKLSSKAQELGALAKSKKDEAAKSLLDKGIALSERQLSALRNLKSSLS